MFWRPKKRHALERDYCSIFTNRNKTGQRCYILQLMPQQRVSCGLNYLNTIARLLANSSHCAPQRRTSSSHFIFFFSIIAGEKSNAFTIVDPSNDILLCRLNKNSHKFDATKHVARSLRVILILFLASVMIRTILS